MGSTPTPPPGRRRSTARYRRSLGPTGESIHAQRQGAVLWRQGRRATRRLQRRLSRRLRGQRTRAVGAAVLLGLAVGVVFAWPWWGRAGADDRFWAQVPPGQSHDGIPLPAQHPLAAPLPPDDDPIASAPPEAWAHPSRRAAPASAAAGTPGTVLPPAPVVAGLRLHLGCAWGEPGRNPYRGTPEQVLAALRLPPALVKTVGERIRAGDRTDRVTIGNSGIRRHGSDREYSAQRVALSFGHSLCLNTRVNFAPGHREQGDLYEVADAEGRVVTVMVPDVCGNVSVLDVDGDAVLRQALDDTQPAHTVPLGSTLGHALIGLGLLFAVRRASGTRQR